MILFRYCPLGYKRWCLIVFLRISAFFSCTVRENQVETWWHGFFSKPEVTNCDRKRYGAFPPPSGGRSVPPSSSPHIRMSHPETQYRFFPLSHADRQEVFFLHFTEENPFQLVGAFYNLPLNKKCELNTVKGQPIGFMIRPHGALVDWCLQIPNFLFHSSFAISSAGIWFFSSLAGNRSGYSPLVRMFFKYRLSSLMSSRIRLKSAFLLYSTLKMRKFMIVPTTGVVMPKASV